MAQNVDKSSQNANQSNELATLKKDFEATKKKNTELIFELQELNSKIDGSFHASISDLQNAVKQKGIVICFFSLMRNTKKHFFHLIRRSRSW